ncbi:MAG: DoxX family protein [Sedimenticolaceae bacterium]
MNERNLNAYGTTLLRISLGIILIAHSVYLKLVVFTLPGTAQFFGSLGLPAELAYIVFAVEALGGLALVLGIETRWVALVLLPVLAGATWAHLPSGWLFTNTGGGWEYPAFLTIAAAVQALLGDGAWALRRSSSLGLVRSAVVAT